MKKLMMMAFINDDAGLTMVEYAIAGGLVAATVALAFTNLGVAILGQITILVAAI